VRKMSIGWNYVGKLTPMRSNISRFSRGTIVPGLYSVIPVIKKLDQGTNEANDYNEHNSHMQES
jgi:hypothetical protein